MTTAYIRDRSLWTSRPITKKKVEWQNKVTDYRIHHTGGAGPVGQSRATIESEKQRLREIERDAIRRGYSCIPYSYVIMPSGRIWEGRGFEIMGGHTEGYNKDIGVAWDGDHQKRPPTKASVAAYFELRRILAEHEVKPGKSIPHYRTSATLCCGKYLAAALHLA